MNEKLMRKVSRGAADTRTVAAVVVVGLLILAAVYFFWPEPEVEPVPSPAQAPGSMVEPPPLQVVEPAKTGEERGDSAREVIAELKAATGATDYQQAYARAQAFQADGHYADAHLLYFFAARGGYGPAAFDLGETYDPNHFQQDQGLMDGPDALQAYRWYKQALASGVEPAAGRLTQLRVWAEEPSRAGDVKAEQLLLQWK